MTIRNRFGKGIGSLNVREGGGAAAIGLRPFVQHFSITLGATDTSKTYTLPISVDTARSHVVWGGQICSADVNAQYTAARLSLASGSTVQADRSAQDGATTVTVYGCVVQWPSSVVTTVRQGTVSITGTNTTNTAAISSVTTTRTLLFYLGATSARTSRNLATAFANVDLTNGTTVTGNRVSAGGVSHTTTVGFVAVQFDAALVDEVDNTINTSFVTSPNLTALTNQAPSGASLWSFRGHALTGVNNPAEDLSQVVAAGASLVASKKPNVTQAAGVKLGHLRFTDDYVKTLGFYDIYQNLSASVATAVEPLPDLTKTIAQYMGVSAPIATAWTDGALDSNGALAAVGLGLVSPPLADPYVAMTTYAGNTQSRVSAAIQEFV